MDAVLLEDCELSSIGRTLDENAYLAQWISVALGGVDLDIVVIYSKSDSIVN